MKKQYDTEKEGQINFYKRFLKRVDSNLNLEDIISDNNDGVLNGNLLEFKKNISNLNEHLFQTIKYLSAMRLKGKPVPATIIIIDLNDGKGYVYSSENYIKYIEKIYQGGASKNNYGFVGNAPDIILNYEDEILDTEKLISILKEKKYTKINIDENCIVGWATVFYKTVPGSRKEDFIGDNVGEHKILGEIRNPKVFKDYIHPYKGKTNVKFNYLMDRLNDTLQKKNLGAFYTPSEYAKKSLELVRKAIRRVPKENDYIILDRCAGTGNLEQFLTDEEMSHCIVSTIEYYEYKVLQELIGSKVRHIIPPIESEETFNAGLVTGADALSEEYLNNNIIKQYIDNPKCTIILFENPPYVETTSIEHQRQGEGKNSSTWKNSFVVKEMKKEVKGQVTNDLGNVFIWSAFKYYLRQSTDSYIVYSPVKYWKSQHLINKEFGGGFAFNRKHFHTKIDACIMVAYWKNIDANIEEIMLQGYDLTQENILGECINIPVKRVYNLFSSKYYDKRSFSNSSEDGILLGLNGEEAKDVKKRIKPLYAPDMLGYLVADSVGFDNPDAKSSLLIAGRYNGNGFYLHKDNYLSKLPLFCASRYITYNRDWTERSRIMKSADGYNNFCNDVENGKANEFLLKCLLFTCIEMQNHMRTFTGTDGRFYRNELCLDITNGPTLASVDIKNLKLNNDEEIIMKQWEILIDAAKKTKEYNPNYTYGLYQIYDEIDTYYEDINGNKIWNNIEVHSALQTMKILCKNYYNKEIVPELFKYEFLK